MIAAFGVSLTLTWHSRLVDITNIHSYTAHMATTDNELIVQRPLAEFAYDLKAKYNQTHGMSKADFMSYYDTGEIQLSSVYENLFVAVNNALGGDVTKVSDHYSDFSNGGDMKISNLQQNSDRTRYDIRSVANKTGMIYFVGNNWIKNKINGRPMPDFYAIPKQVYGSPAKGIKIARCSISGDRVHGKYNYHCYDTFEDIAMAVA